MSESHNDAYLDAIADADPYPYWYEDADEPDSNPTLVRSISCDLCVVGGGYTGLWTAILAKERDPSRDVVLIDAREVGSAASGRNGGFMEASLTHGVANGQERFPDELAALERLGLENLNQIEAAIKRYGIDCDYERTGVIDVATTNHSPSYFDELREDHAQLRHLGQRVELLDREAMQQQVHSPTYIGGLWRKDRAALVDPARLAWGLKAVADRSGSASSRTPRPPPSSVMAWGCWSPPRSARSVPVGWRWEPTPSRRCCAGWATTSPRSTTTAW
jgi:hypothetical protein